MSILVLHIQYSVRNLGLKEIFEIPPKKSLYPAKSRGEFVRRLAILE